MGIDALLASACAPLSFQAVDIDGEFYWDGSYGCAIRTHNAIAWPCSSHHNYWLSWLMTFSRVADNF
jgi:predicted acylesterase/phospholipase RssA